MQIAQHDNVQGDGKLLQIKSAEDHRGLELIDLWTCLIPAKLSNTVLNFLRDKLPPEPVPIPHLRRLAPDEDEPDKSLLRLLVCTVEVFPDREKLEELVRQALETQPAPKPKKIKKKLQSDEAATSPTQDEEEKLIAKKPKIEALNTVDITNPKIALLTKRQGAKFQAHTKEQSVEWSQDSWPIMWRGNPAAVKTPLSDSEVDNITRYLTQVQHMCVEARASKGLPVATVIVNPTTDTIVASSCDKRGDRCPLDHSIMVALRKAANSELEKRRVRDTKHETTESSEVMPETEETYLCLDMHVYTSHEPCVMCAMALVHSRIARLVYVESSPRTGGIEPSSGAGHSVHWNRLLNWTYQAWKWLDKPAFPEIPYIDETLNA